MALVGCAPSLKPDAFINSTPAFDPLKFWTGKTESWEVMENRNGAPTAIVITRTEGTADGADALHMVQHVIVDGKDTKRDWHMRRLSAGHFEATANDMIGTALGEASGRTFHWEWTLATRPGNDLFNVTMEQWMYLADNGTLMNRTIIRKFGQILTEVSEQFVRQD